MDIHEYQAKEILASFGVTIPEEASYIVLRLPRTKLEIGGSKWVVKAQIHSGARESWWSNSLQFSSRSCSSNR